MTNIIKRGINSNTLKTIALIAMVIDHIGFYFSAAIPSAIYIACRYIGRIAMPIFVYLLVQGFFHTKNFKKYIIRLSILATVTQLLITILMFANLRYIPSYTAAKQIYIEGNIIFAFVISLGLLKILHESILAKKWDYNKNISLKIILVILIMVAVIIIPIDYGIETVLLSTFLYYIEKFRIQIYLKKSSGTLSVKNILLNSISETQLKSIYLFLILMALSMLLIYFGSYWTVLLAIVPIALYNGEGGKTNLKYVYYITFTLQHVILYLIAMLTLT